MTKGDVASLCRQYLQKGDCAWDIGASDGEITKVMLQAVGPTGAVLAVDPDPTYRVPPHPQVTRHQCAIGGPSLPPVRLGENPRHSSSYAVAIASGRTIAGPVVALDALDGPRPRLVKLDVQGAEGEVVDSGPILLRETRPVWIVECWPHGLAAAGTSPLKLLERFWAAGYQVLWPTGVPVTQDSWAVWAREKTGPTRYVNLVAVP